jgi:hypothetical protein
VVHALNFIFLRRDDADRGPGFFQRFHRPFEFGLFKAIGGEDGDPFIEK